MVNTVNQELVTSYPVRVKHVWDLVIYIELPVSDCQRQVEVPGGESLWIGRIINNVQTGKTHPYVATGNVHAMVVIKLHLTALGVAFFNSVISIGTRSASRDEQSVGLTVTNGRRMIAVVMDGHLAGCWIEVIRKCDVGCLPGGSANC